MTDIGWNKESLGIRCHERLLGAGLPGATLVDATALVNWQRMVKSADEIAFMRKAATISEKIVRLGIELARPGLKKNELVGEISRAALYGVGEDWGDYPGHRAVDTVRGRRVGATSDLGRGANADGNGHVL